jgi:tripartite-type tricarboxylate transporter receptor subunit TctC
MKSVKIISPFPAGGATDVLARLLALNLSQSLGQSFVVESRPGAGGNIGTDLVAKANPDGYVIGISSSGPLANNKYLYKSMPFDGLQDFSHIILVAIVPMVIVANNAVQANSLSDLIKIARTKPGQFNVGTPGNGTMGHLTLELLKSLAQINMVHVPFKGGPPLTSALISGDVQISIDVITPYYVKQILNGSIKGISVTTDTRFPGLPKLQSASEQGLSGLEAYTWFALIGPAGLPKSIVESVNQETNKYINSSIGKEKMIEIGAQPMGGPPERVVAQINMDSVRWKQLIEKNNVKID